jgi:hypothetical protein
MSSIGQVLPLVIAGVSTPAQWFGGKGKIFAWDTAVASVDIEVSPNGGVNWIKVQNVINDGVLMSQSAALAISATFSQPAILVKAVGNGSSSNLNVVLVGYDDGA